MEQRQNQTYSPCNSVLSSVSLEHVVRVRIVFPELLDDVLAHIAVVFLDLASNAHLVLRRHGCHLTTLTKQVQHELSDITSGDWNVLNRTADDITFCAWNNVSDTIARVDDCPS